MATRYIYLTGIRGNHQVHIATLPSRQPEVVDHLLDLGYNLEQLAMNDFQRLHAKKGESCHIIEAKTKLSDIT